MKHRITMALAAAAWLPASIPLLGEEAGLASMEIEDLLNVRVVSASRHEQRQIDSPRSLSVVTADEIRRRGYRTVPEALNGLAGVMVQHTNYAGGSPIVRGLIGNRVLILIDGVRINNAIYRLGPNQYLNTIDIHRVERIEVVRGPGSVLYGSDALGGLINVITRKGDRAAPPGFGGGIEARAASADRSVSTRAGFRGRAGALSLAGGVSLARFGDLRGGGLAGRQLNTGYDMGAGDLSLGYSLGKGREISFSVDQARHEDARRTDLLASGSDRRYDWNPQLRGMMFAQYRHGSIGRAIESIQIGFTAQRHRERIERVASSRPSELRTYDDRVRTEGFFAQAASRWGERQLLTYGADYYVDRVGSEREDFDSVRGLRTREKSTFADGSRFKTVATFLQDEIQVTSSLAVNLRARYSRFHLNAVTSDQTTGPVTVHNDPGALTTGAHFSQRLRSGVFLVGGIGQGFRAPNVDDSTISGSFAGGYEVPNPALRPEQARNYEAGVKIQRKRFTGTATGFLSRFRDLIDRAPGEYNGLAFLDLNGNRRRDTGEDAVFQRKNVGRARIHGVELDGTLLLGDKWIAAANASWIRGVDTVQHAPLTRIPPAKGELTLRWLATRRIWVEPWSLYAWRQTRLSTADRADRRIRPGGTPGFVLGGVRAGFEIPNLGLLTAGFENAANKRYRWHGSGIDGPGRGVVVALSRWF